MLHGAFHWEWGGMGWVGWGVAEWGVTEWVEWVGMGWGVAEWGGVGRGRVGGVALTQ